MRYEGKMARPLFVAVIATAGAVSAAGAQTPLWQGLNVSLEGAPQLLTSFPKNVFAQEITVPIPGITPLSTVDRRLAPDFGGTVKFSFENRFGPWDMGVAYRGSFSGRIEDRTGLAVTAAPITATFPVYPGVIIGPGGIPIPIGGINGTAESSSALHAADLEIGHSTSYPWGELRVFGGARFAHYSTQLLTRYSNLGLAEFEVERNTRYWGIGPRLGVGATVPLSSNWWVHGNVAGAVLFGNRKTTENSGVTPIVGPTLSSGQSNSGGRTAFSFDAEIALSYLMRGGWYATIGYSAQSYIGVTDSRRLDPLASLLALQQVTTGTSAGSIVNHGPFIKIGWRPGLYNEPGSSPGPHNLPRGTVAVEGRFFPLGPAHAGQRPQDISFWGEAEWGVDLADRSRFSVKPFFRYDTSDDRRTHWDLREAFWQKEFQDFRLRVGVARVFWGTLESAHLVDIINQVDQVEAPDISSLTEYRLGQPMVHLSLPRSWGTIDAFYLPYSRERTFPGQHGRLRSRIAIDTDDTQFENSLGHWYPSFAVRYSHSISNLDFGVYYFHGTSRDPSFKVLTPIQLPVVGGPQPTVVPVYQVINQGGIDASYTRGPWQFKFEGLVREGFNNFGGKEETYVAGGIGGEYTFKSFFDTGADVGVLAEFLWDSRGRRSTTLFENDMFVGVRVNLNDKDDTRALLGYIQDVKDSDKIIYFGASRRITDAMRIDLQARFFLNPSADRILYDVRKDHYLQVSLQYRF